MRAIYVTVLLFLLAARASADGLADEASDFIRQQLKLSHAPGISLGILKDGKAILAQGYGLANIELSVPATPDTVYGLLSVSKQFTAAAVMLLKHDGRISLDDPLGKYLLDLSPAWDNLPIRCLLSHTSGIPDYTNLPGFFQNIRDDSTPIELIHPLASLPLRFAPGTAFSYSNTNYYLLGMLIEKVSGISLGQFLAERIFQPLQMTSTRLDDRNDIIPNRAGGYQWIGQNINRPPPIVTGYHGRNNVLQNAIYMSPTRLWAAGGIVSSVNDLLKWEEALEEGSLLTKETVSEMSQPFKLTSGAASEYGYGNEVGEIRGHRYAGHQGNGIAFNSSILRLVDDKLTVIVLCNQTSAQSLRMAVHIAGIYLPDLRGFDK